MAGPTGPVPPALLKLHSASANAFFFLGGIYDMISPTLNIGGIYPPVPPAVDAYGYTVENAHKIPLTDG